MTLLFSGGICSRSHNVGLVSGCLHGHKVGEFDIFRSTMHVLGHLFGAKEDDIANPLCKLNVVHSPNVFNPTLMDSYQKIDVGIRPNSMRFSACAKLDIAAFLTTPNVHCLRSVQATPRCGNGQNSWTYTYICAFLCWKIYILGWVEGGEQCDCGLPWQCHTDEMEKPSCCGESDTFLGCKKIGSHRYKTGAHCHRPFVWWKSNPDFLHTNMNNSRILCIKKSLYRKLVLEIRVQFQSFDKFIRDELLPPHCVENIIRDIKEMRGSLL